MSRMKLFTIILTLVLVMTGCGTGNQDDAKDSLEEYDAVEIQLSDEGITVDGEAVTSDKEAAVYTANDIVYYEEGKDFTYGEGDEKDAHSAQEAEAHTVVHITKAGTYSLSGKLSKGQIAVDLGEDAEENTEAVVTLILNGADITCEVAPAVIFYNVYECGSTDSDTATKDVDTTFAGANVIIADDTVNRVQGSYVARIYKPDTVVLNEDKTEVEDAKKLHKYDAAFYSKMSMNMKGEEKNTGVLDIYADNEGLDSELHLTVNGGNINIYSGNDGINTNEDGVSVTTVNGGNLTILVTGETGEGDGIDSNGWLVINGGTVIASACSNSADAGIDSDMGIHINGGTVIAAGHMLDSIEEGGQTYAVFSFAQKQDGKEELILKNQEEKAVLTHKEENAFSILVYSSPDLVEGTYTLWNGETQLSGQTGGAGGFGMPGGMPGGMTNGEMPENMPEGMENGKMPEGFQGGMTNGEMPEGFPGGMTNGEMPEGFPGGMTNGEIPEGFSGGMANGEMPGRPDGNWQNMPQGGKNPFGGGTMEGAELSKEFAIKTGANMFSNIS